MVLRYCSEERGGFMNINWGLAPLLTANSGILIWPRLLNDIAAIYLIAVGPIGIFGWTDLHARRVY